MSLPRAEDYREGGLHNRATLLTCTCPWAVGLERRAQHIAHYMGEGGNTRKFWIKHPFHFCSSQPSEKLRESVSSPNPWAHGSSSPRIPQRAQCLMLAKHGHTETKSTERQQRNPKLDTENTTSNVISIIILSKTCRLIFAECFLLFSFFVFFFQHTYCI